MKINIAIIGPIGVGKSTFLSKICDKTEDNIYHEIDVIFHSVKTFVAVTNDLNHLNEKPDLVIYIDKDSESNSLNIKELESKSEYDYLILNIFDSEVQKKSEKKKFFINLKKAESYAIMFILNNIINRYCCSKINSIF